MGTPPDGQPHAPVSESERQNAELRAEVDRLRAANVRRAQRASAPESDAGNTAPQLPGNHSGSTTGGSAADYEPTGRPGGATYGRIGSSDYESVGALPGPGVVATYELMPGDATYAAAAPEPHPDARG